MREKLSFLFLWLLSVCILFLSTCRLLPSPRPWLPVIWLAAGLAFAAESLYAQYLLTTLPPDATYTVAGVLQQISVLEEALKVYPFDRRMRGVLGRIKPAPRSVVLLPKAPYTIAPADAR